MNTSTTSSEPLPLVSVLMPAFNAERYIGQAITSILQQSYPHFEFIICNDGSLDQTEKIVQEFTDPRILYLSNPGNQGLIFTRNRLVEAAQGKYIAYLDADDIAFPKRLALQVALLESGVADICGGTHLTLYSATGKLKKSKDFERDADLRALMTIYCPICNPAVMGKASLFKEHPYSKDFAVAEDYALWQTLAMAGARFTNLKDTLITYRVYPEQTSQVKETETQHANHILQKRYLQGLNIDPELYPRALPIQKRITTALKMMRSLNQHIPGISLKANYQIYARYQFRTKGLMAIINKCERLLMALICTLA